MKIAPAKSGGLAWSVVFSLMMSIKSEYSSFGKYVISEHYGGC